MKARIILTVALVAASARVADAQILYSQNFENPTGFVNDGGDINIFRTVNDLYGNQPVGFTFSQNFTVETLHIGGTAAFGVGYSDPQARGGSYALGLLSDSQNDLLGLAFNVGAFKFLNFQVDVSSIDLDRFGGPFVPAGGLAPTFRFSLYDNPGGASGLGSGTALSFADVTGVAGANKFTFNWTNFIVALDATGNTNGNVILRADLLSGGYAAMDNFVVAASNVAGEVPTVAPEPSTYAMLGLGLIVVGAVSRRKRQAL
ncbi:MAG: PEP-CTERM sorting domain-containing protein [Gemmatimonas sp.]